MESVICMLLRTLIIALLILCSPQPRVEAADDFYTLEDGFALEKDSAAVLIYGGYPRSGLAYIAAPWNYVNMGMRLEADYDPGFSLGAPVKVQLLESPEGKLNFALTLTPALYFNFVDTDDLKVQFLLNPGFSAGWRIVRHLCYFLSAAYDLHLPVSENITFQHFPPVQSGFEIPTGTLVNVILKGLVEFHDYDPDAFVYGGSLGLGLALW